jgi:hypothetical protein
VAITAALSATTGSVSAQMAAAMKELKSEAATILAAILAVGNLIMPDAFPTLLDAFVIGKARTRAGTITSGSLLASANRNRRWIYIKNQGELYFGIRLGTGIGTKRSVASNRCRYVSTLAKNICVLLVGVSSEAGLPRSNEPLARGARRRLPTTKGHRNIHIGRNANIVCCNQSKLSEEEHQVGRTRCPLMAQSGHPTVARQCPLLGVKRTSKFKSVTSAFAG